MKFNRLLFLLVFIASSLPLFSQEGISDGDLKVERKNKRITKRFVHPKSVFLQLSSGWTVNQMKFSKQDDFFQRKFYTANAFSYSAKIEVGTRNDFFYEIGASLRQYGYKFRSNKFPFYLGDKTYFGVLKLHGGYGKRIILKKNNLNIINVQAGISLSYNFSHAHLHYAGYRSGDEDVKIRNHEGYTVTQYGATSPHKVFPTLYIGLTKDIRIFRTLYLTMEYQYDQGFLSTVKQKIEYYKDSNPSEVTTLYNHFRGTAHAFSLGLKYRFLAEKYR